MDQKSYSPHDEPERHEGLFRILIESSPNALVMADQNGRITLVNSQAERLFGYVREELLGQTVERLVPKNARDGHAAQRGEFYTKPAQRPMGAGRDLCAVRKDGTEVPVEIGLTPIPGPDGLSVLATITDISERKRAEVTHRKMAEDLLRSNRELEHFASMVSHDLQQPLVVISGYLDLLNKREAGKLDQESDEYIRIAIDQVQHMQQMIRGMLEYARVGHEENPLQPTDLEEVIQRVLDVYQPEIARIAGTIAHDPLPTVRGDPVQLAQLFQNLIGNALKFRSTEKPPAIHIGARNEGHCWLMSIRDNGIGLDPARIGKIFEPFQQLNRRDYPGAGLGLAICKKIVERHGGGIWAQSNPEGGSTFFFTIPN